MPPTCEVRVSGRWTFAPSEFRAGGVVLEPGGVAKTGTKSGVDMPRQSTSQRTANVLNQRGRGMNIISSTAVTTAASARRSGS